MRFLLSMSMYSELLPPLLPLVQAWPPHPIEQPSEQLSAYPVGDLPAASRRNRFNRKRLHMLYYLHKTRQCKRQTEYHERTCKHLFSFNHGYGFVFLWIVDFRMAECVRPELSRNQHSSQLF